VRFCSQPRRADKDMIRGGSWIVKGVVIEGAKALRKTDQGPPPLRATVKSLQSAAGELDLSQTRQPA
jgi:hypothetical protein